MTMIILNVLLTLGIHYFFRMNVSLLRNEEVGVLKNRKMIVVMCQLNDLYRHEWYFEHPLLYELHTEIKRLCYKYTSVRDSVISTIERWDQQKRRRSLDIIVDSHVTLVPILRDFISQNEKQMLCNLVDEIKMSSL